MFIKLSNGYNLNYLKKENPIKNMSQMTTKDLTEISELLDGENLAFKKCVTYAAIVTDKNLADQLHRYANAHKQRYAKLLTYLTSQ